MKIDDTKVKITALLPYFDFFEGTEFQVCKDHWIGLWLAISKVAAVKKFRGLKFSAKPDQGLSLKLGQRREKEKSG